MANHFNNKWEIKCRTNLQKHSIWLKLKIRRSYCDLFLLFSVRRIVVAATVVDVVVFSSEICQVEVQWNSTHNKTKKMCARCVCATRTCLYNARQMWCKIVYKMIYFTGLCCLFGIVLKMNMFDQQLSFIFDERKTKSDFQINKNSDAGISGSWRRY